MTLVRRLLFLVIVFVLFWPFTKELIWQKTNMNLMPSSFSKVDESKAMYFDTPVYRGIGWVRAHTSEKEKFFVVRQSDFAHYAGRPFLYVLDPKTAPLYKAGTIDELKSVLAGLGIRYFFLQSYDLPFTYNTLLMELLNDPRQSELMFYDEGVKIVRLIGGEGEIRSPIGSSQLSLKEESWFCTGMNNSKCRGILAAEDATISLTSAPGASHEERINLLYGIGQGFVSPLNMGFDLPIDPSSDYEFIAEVEGEARLQLDMAVSTKMNF